MHEACAPCKIATRPKHCGHACEIEIQSARGMCMQPSVLKLLSFGHLMALRRKKLCLGPNCRVAGESDLRMRVS